TPVHRVTRRAQGRRGTSPRRMSAWVESGGSQYWLVPNGNSPRVLPAFQAMRYPCQWVGGLMAAFEHVSVLLAFAASKVHLARVMVSDFRVFVEEIVAGVSPTAPRDIIA